MLKTFTECTDHGDRSQEGLFEALVTGNAPTVMSETPERQIAFVYTPLYH